MYKHTALEAENRVLQQVLRHLSADATHNEAVMDRYQERELALLTAQGLRLLLERLTVGIQVAFRLDAISLALADPDHLLDELMRGVGIDVASLMYVQMLPDLGEWCPLYADLAAPLLGTWDESAHARLFDARGLQSVALLPLRRGNSLIAVLNLGSRDPERFTESHATGFLARFANIAAVCLENAINRERLRLTGLTDALTGLYNRHYLDRRLREEVALTRRHHQPLACLFVDADHFKRINDSRGHIAGDQVLVEIGRRIRNQLRSSDLAIRYGGEEFVLILPQTDAQEAVCMAERLRQFMVDQPVPLGNGDTLRITVSIGVGELAPRANGDVDELAAQLLAEADRAAYAAKAAGRNRVCGRDRPGA